jgi:hypothetical protein
MRCFRFGNAQPIYLLFILGWLFLAQSIWHGRRAQSVYLAYLLTSHHTDAKTLLDKKTVDVDLGHQLDYLERGLFVFALWLVGYLAWWIFSANSQRDGLEPHGTLPRRRDALPVVPILIFLLACSSFATRAAFASSGCDCSHTPGAPRNLQSPAVSINATCRSRTSRPPASCRCFTLMRKLPTQS